MFVDFLDLGCGEGRHVLAERHPDLLGYGAFEFESQRTDFLIEANDDFVIVVFCAERQHARVCLVVAGLCETLRLQ